jgi:hypothetical protein
MEAAPVTRADMAAAAERAPRQARVGTLSAYRSDAGFPLTRPWHTVSAVASILVHQGTRM